jgi:hypothetical protein
MKESLRPAGKTALRPLSSVHRPGEAVVPRPGEAVVPRPSVPPTSACPFKFFGEKERSGDRIGY